MASQFFIQNFGMMTTKLNLLKAIPFSNFKRKRVHNDLFDILNNVFFISNNIGTYINFVT